MKFDELYKKVIDSCMAFEERQVPISLDFKIEDLCDALVESNVTIDKLAEAKKSAEQILKNLLDCGLIKEWYFNGKFNAVLKADDPHLQIKELNAKLNEAEDARYEAGADAADYYQENRRLKRALWLARAERASDKARIFYFAETCGVKLNIDGYSNKEKGHTRMCTDRWWRLTWLKVERKCRAKAERYK